MYFIGIIGISGFILTLIVMEKTKLGVPGIKAYSPGFRILDMRFRYSSNDVFAALSEIGEGGRQAYRRFLLIDFVFIFFFFTVMFFLSNILVTGSFSLVSLILFAGLRGLCDIAENSLILFFIDIFPNRKNKAYGICSWFTTFKFTFLIVWAVLYCFFLILYLFGN
ncbi:MAG: hypothetical protein ABF289_13540 [Clostridiales bacterium]